MNLTLVYENLSSKGFIKPLDPTPMPNHINGNLEEEIYMMQPKGFIAKNQENMVCKLKRSNYGLEQASRSWNIRFDQAIKLFCFKKNLDDPCVYK